MCVKSRDRSYKLTRRFILKEIQEMEFKNVKEVINFLFELGDPATVIFVDDIEGNIDNYKEELRKALYQLCDMLGMEDLYLYPNKDKEAD